MAKKDKKAKYNKQEPQKGKAARVDQRLVDLEHNRPSWVLSIMDMNGPWGWQITAEKLLEIRQTLANYESMQWGSIFGGTSGCHSIPKSKLCKEARDRLEEIHQDDVDELVSMRKAGKERVWGIKDRDVLKLLWWDPEHTVYPVEKKNT